MASKFPKNFNAAEDEKLVECVANCPVLYDSSNPDYNNQAIRENMWRQISSAVRRSPEECKLRWHNYSYMKLKKNAASNAQRKSKCPPTQQNLTDNVSGKRSCQNSTGPQLPAKEDIYFEDVSNESLQTPAQIMSVKQPITVRKAIVPLSPSIQAKKRRDDSTKILQMLLERSSEREKIIHGMYCSKCVELENPVQLFFKSMAMTVQTFDPELMTEAKSRIYAVVNELETKSLDMKKCQPPLAPDNPSDCPQISPCNSP